ncbi:GAF domain-containing protein [Mycolicibacterium iranicum]|uniref:GAF domain-containing protein n=1 Tax=Mycolicibacterium iranicum TaxID=912594 RepID=UPI001618430D
MASFLPHFGHNRLWRGQPDREAGERVTPSVSPTAGAGERGPVVDERRVAAVLNDPGRLLAVYTTGLLDSGPEAHHDRVARTAAAALAAPSAALTVVGADHQVLVGAVDAVPRSRRQSLDLFCQYVVANGAPIVVADARRDPLFASQASVRQGRITSYLGVPLTDHWGHAVGALFVYDPGPRMWGSGHVQILGDLAEVASTRIFESTYEPHR